MGFHSFPHHFIISIISSRNSPHWVTRQNLQQYVTLTHFFLFCLAHTLTFSVSLSWTGTAQEWRNRKIYSQFIVAHYPWIVKWMNIQLWVMAATIYPINSLPMTQSQHQQQQRQVRDPRAKKEVPQCEMDGKLRNKNTDRPTRRARAFHPFRSGTRFCTDWPNGDRFVALNTIYTLSHDHDE